MDEQVASILAAKQPLHGLAYWAKSSSCNDLQPVLRVALSHADPIVLENALRCLSGSKALPFLPELLPLVRHPSADVRNFAARTLGRHVDTAVRETGLTLLPEDMTAALQLLRRNALPDDASAVLQNLGHVADVHDRHDVCSTINQLLTDSPTVRDSRLALYVYEHSPCRHCRCSAVKHLCTCKTCPAWLLDEGRFDASEEIRALVGQVSAAK